MTQAVGIDLGTTYSAIAVLDPYGRPLVIPNAEGQAITPSVVSISSAGEVLVGESAKELQGTEQTVAAYFKRFMGEPNYQINLNGQFCDPVALSAHVLRKLKQDAESYLGQPVKDAVITVPAYFNNLQREATVQAGEQAGLKVLQIINEPTAAALAFGINQQKAGLFLVYDLGGGTFDITLMRLAQGEIQVLATDGDHLLGGKDWDDAIVNFLATSFQEQTGLNPLEDIGTAYDLLLKAEQAKMQLSQREKTPLRLMYQGQSLRLELSRSDFEVLTEYLMRRTQALCEDVLHEKEVAWSELNGVLLVGGSTRMPMVSQYIQAMSGKAPLSGVNVDQAVALGAALLAADLQPTTHFTLGARKIQDVTSHCLGLVATIEDHSRYINSVILNKNKPLPCQETRPFKLRTHALQPNQMEAYMLQGELEDPLDCAVIKYYLFEGITHQPTGETTIDVTYHYNLNNLLDVSAQQRETGQALQVKSLPIPEDLSWLGEAPKAESLPAHLSIVLVIDLSGSMSGTAVKTAAKAATEFLEKLDLTSSSVALVIFADDTEVQLDFSQNQRLLSQEIEAWPELCRERRVGAATSGNPFPAVLQLLQQREDPRYAVVLTDGEWFEQEAALYSASQCKDQGIEIIALGFGTADEDFLRQLATADENALLTSLDQLGQSFSRIAQALTQHPTAHSGGLRIWTP